MNPTDIPKSHSQRWEWIKFQLRIRGTSFASLARELGVMRNAVTGVKRMPYPRMERAIAREIGLPPAMIWPERWNADGTPNRQRPSRAEAQNHKTANTQICTQDSASNVDMHRQAVARA